MSLFIILWIIRKIYRSCKIW